MTLVLGIWLLDHQPGSNRRSFTKSLSTSAGVNRLSAARLFLFCSRDIWFVVALPVFLQSQLGWSPVQVGSLMAAWVIIYGGIQAMAPRVTGARTPGGNTLFLWAALLSLLPCVIAFGLATGINPGLVLVIGLLIFGAVFAINSSVHSYLILALAQRESASLDVGFYYMANAGGRLLGTLLSGLIYQQFGLVSCLLMSSLLIAASALLARGLESQSV
jgi:predicted MFS family arabinose efflux permease